MKTRVNHAPSDASLQIDALDGLRGVAILFVLLAHLSNHEMYLIPATSFSRAGNIGVWLFFVLSAFLLTRPFLERSRSYLRDRRFWANYFLRRFLRIFPLYSFILVLSLVVGSYFQLPYPFPINFDELVNHLLLLEGKNALWTIPVEFSYYFLLPVVALLFIGVKRNVALGFIAVLALTFLSWRLWPPGRARGAFLLGPYVPVFLVGSFAALVYSRSASLRNAIPSWARYACEGVALLSLMLVLVTVPGINRHFSGDPLPNGSFRPLMYAVLWSLFLLSILHGAGIFRSVLCWRPLRIVGIVSFSMYLWHPCVIRLVERFSALPPGLNAWIALFATVAIASLTYVLLEKPCMKVVIRRPADRRETVSA